MQDTDTIATKNNQNFEICQKLLTYKKKLVKYYFCYIFSVTNPAAEYCTHLSNSVSIKITFQGSFVPINAEGIKQL